MNTPRGRILHIQKVAGIAGSENHLLTLLPQLAQHGYKPTMLVLADSKDRPGPFIERMRDAGVPAPVIPMLPELDPLLLPRLVCFIRQGAYQIVHTHLFHADLYGTLAARIAGIKVIISTRHNDDAFRRLYPLRLLIRWINRYCHHIIYISKSLQRFSKTIEKTPLNRLTVIHYGLNSKVVSANPKWRQQFGWGEDVSVLGIVARLTTQKGHSTLLSAMSKVVRKFPAAQLVIVGDGELRGQLQRYTSNLAIKDHVHFLGYNNNAAAMMTGFDVFVHPSRWEGFGMVFLEAMAAGLPIVATQVGSIPEIVQHGQTGLLVPVDDAEALHRAICTLLADQHLAKSMGKTGRYRLEKEFSVSAMVERTCALYTHLLSKKFSQDKTLKMVNVHPPTSKAL